MNTVLRVVLLSIVIFACFLITFYTPYIIKYNDTFLDLDPDSCVDAIIDKLSTLPQNANLSRDAMYNQLTQQMTFDNSALLTSQGVNVATLPDAIKNSLPKVQLMDIIAQFKRNIAIDEKGNDVPLNQCIVPLSVVNRFRNQTTSNTIQVKGVSSTSVQDTPTSPFYNSQNKQCVIGAVSLTTNIPNSLANDNDIQTMIAANPKNTGVKAYGCILPIDDVLSSTTFRTNVTEMYKYSDVASMNVLRSAVNSYGTAVTTNTQATAANTSASQAMNESSAARTAAEASKAQATQVRIQNEQTAQAAKASADAAASTYGTATATASAALNNKVP